MKRKHDYNIAIITACVVLYKIAILAAAVGLSVHTENYHWMWLVLWAMSVDFKTKEETIKEEG